MHSLYISRAGVAAEKAGDFQLAIQCYADSSNEEAVKRIVEEEGLALFAMTTYGRKKDFVSAGKFAEMSGLDNLAIKFYEKAGKPALAGAVAERQGDLESAANYFARCDDGYPVLNFVHRTGEDKLGERALAEAGCFFWAGHVAIQEGRYDSAISYYVQGGYLSYAAKAAKKSGNQTLANKFGEQAIVKDLEKGCFDLNHGLAGTIRYVEMSPEREILYNRIVNLIDLPDINNL